MRLNMFLMRVNYDIFNAENGRVRSGYMLNLIGHV